MTSPGLMESVLFAVIIIGCIKLSRTPPKGKGSRFAIDHHLQYQAARQSCITKQERIPFCSNETTFSCSEATFFFAAKDLSVAHDIHPQ